MNHIEQDFRAGFDSFQAMIERYRSLSDDEKAEYAARHDERVRAEYAELQRLRRVELARSLSHVAERFADRTFANYDPARGNESMTSALALAQLVADDYSTGAWFYGDEGLGKTHLVAAIAHEYIERGIPCPYVSAVRLHDEIKQSYNGDGDVRNGKRDILASLAAMDALIIDDIDKPVPSQHFTERMYRLVNDRYEAKLPIIVTSNYDPADIANAWEKAGGKRGRTTVDRLIEMCKKPGEPGRFVKLTGPSQRGLV